MKLSDVFNSFNLRFREVSNFVRYPVENISRIAQRRAQDIYENIELSGNNQQKKSPEEDIEYRKSREENHEYISNGNGKHSPETFNRFNETVTQTLSRPRQLSCKQTNLLPPLKPGQEIRGRRGRYRVQSPNLNQESEKVRLYQGIHLLNNKSVWIKEYLLPEPDFNQQETKDRKERFELLASVNFKGEGGKDFRLVTPWDAIAFRDERRCYLITEFIDNRITLRKYLHRKQGSMNYKQVRKFLEQVLLSLQYLHTDSKINLPLNERPHGNLNLDSLLISSDELSNNSENEQFFIYLSDFALWEHLFKPPNSKLNHLSVQNDLKDLGYTAFYLLNGGDKDPISGQEFDPKNEKHWSNIRDINLKEFIRSLLGLEGGFSNTKINSLTAEYTRQELLSTPIILQEIAEKIEGKTEEYDNLKSINNSKVLPIVLLIIILSLLVGFTGGIGWLLFNILFKSKVEMPIIGEKYTCCINKVEGIDELQEKSRITYNFPTSEATLRYLMTTPNLVSARKTFPEELSDRIQDNVSKSSSGLSLYFQPVNDIADAVTKLKNSKSDFFITQKSEDELLNTPNANQLKSEIIAHEGIVVFVPFSDAQRENSFPKALNGKISFENLKKLYSGEITNWEKLDNKLPDLPVKLYAPQDEFLVQKFKNLVFKDDPTRASKFEEMLRKNRTIIKQTIPKTLRSLLNEFENKSQDGIGIGFGPLSQIYNQCSVYPLSIGEKGREVQSLVQNNGQDINPKTNLCKKGGYYPNPEVFKENKYPLKYPISVVYPEDEDSSIAGNKFVEILKTDEGQNLLRQAGLVPIRKLNDN